MPDHKKYGSKYAALRPDARGADPILHPATGTVIGYQRPLVAEFGILSDEAVAYDSNGQVLHDQYGQPFMSATIRGHFWDSKQWQHPHADHESCTSACYSDDEADALIALCDHFCRTQPEMIWVIEDIKVAAPWPTYDSQTDKNRVAFAIEGGFVEQALAYAEQEGHEKVVAELRAHLDEQRAEAEAEQALTAV